MGRDTLLFIYGGYVSHILELECVLFWYSAAYNLRPLSLLERRILRLCLGLPRYVANNVLYLEARLRCLGSRLHLLTVQTMLRIFESHLSKFLSLAVAQPALFFKSPWPQYNRRHCVYAESLLSPLTVSIPVILPMFFSKSYLLPSPSATFSPITPNCSPHGY